MTASGCPFCNWPFRYSGALQNHLEKIHLDQSQTHRSTKRKRDDPSEESSNTSTSSKTDVREQREELGIENRLRNLFASYSEHSDLLPPGNNERNEEMPYGDDNQVGDQAIELSDATSLMGNSIGFPADREAGKLLAPYPFQKPRDPTYNFFRPFQSAMDYKLARFFYSARVPRTSIKEFFLDGFLSAGMDSGCSVYSFHLPYRLYKKIDEMVCHSPWKNGFINFRSDKDT